MDITFSGLFLQEILLDIYINKGNKIGKVIVYGDLHGCLDEFKELRKKINPSSHDREIVVGDILDKGPYSKELVRFLRENKIESIVGNHEDKYLRYKRHHENFLATGKEIPMKFGEVKLAMYNSLDEDDFDYLKSLPYIIKIDNLSIVHGGVTNKMDLDNLTNKNIKMIIRLRYLQEDNKMSHTAHKNIYNIRWAELYDGNSGIVIYGHEVFKEVHYDKFAIGLDTGCVYGNKLSALVISNTKDPMNNHNVVQVNAKKVYKEKLLEEDDDE